MEAFQRLGRATRVMRNSIAPDEALRIAEEAEALLVLSPGPGAPAEAGCCLSLIEKAIGRVPLLGVCLGHQAIVHQAGGTLERAAEPVHG